MVAATKALSRSAAAAAAAVAGDAAPPLTVARLQQLRGWSRPLTNFPELKLVRSETWVVQQLQSSHCDRTMLTTRRCRSCRPLTSLSLPGITSPRVGITGQVEPRSKR